MKLVLLFLATAIVCTIANQGGWGGNNQNQNWQVLTTHGSAPSARSWNAGAAFGNVIISFAGFLESLNTDVPVFYNDLHAFDTTRALWFSITPNAHSPIPPVRSYHIAIEAGIELIVGFGAVHGALFADFAPMGDLWAYNVLFNTWKQITPSTAVNPEARAEAAAVRAGSYIYLFGGVNAYFGNQGDTWKFNLFTNAWTEITPTASPSGRYGTVFALGPVPQPHHGWGRQHAPGHDSDDGSFALYMYGGEQTVFTNYGAGFGAPTDDPFWRFNLGSNTWEKLTPNANHNIPFRNNGNGAVWTGTNFFLHGGDIGGGEDCYPELIFQQNNQDSTWAYDSSANNWNQICPPTKITGWKRASTVMVGNVVYSWGGFTIVNCGMIFNSQTWAFSVNGNSLGPVCPS